jgi:hypothetical protein
MGLLDGQANVPEQSVVKGFQLCALPRAAMPEGNFIQKLRYPQPSLDIVSRSKIVEWKIFFA